MGKSRIPIKKDSRPSRGAYEQTFFNQNVLKIIESPFTGTKVKKVKKFTDNLYFTNFLSLRRDNCYLFQRKEHY